MLGKPLLSPLFRPFDARNIPLIAQTVRPLWGVPGREERLDAICVEFIVRENMGSGALSLELDDESGFCAAAFAEKKGEFGKTQEWLSALEPPLSAQERESLYISESYLREMDGRAFCLMNDDDIKLSLFVSRKKGAGFVLLNEFSKRLFHLGFKNMYLWTDVDCNWRWYERRGFSLVQEIEYKKFSRPGEPYRAFIFKRPLSEKGMRRPSSAIDTEEKTE